MTNPPEADFRYAISVLLMRDKRPRFWDFHCPYCTAKVGELEGRLVRLTDMSAAGPGANHPVARVRCTGTKQKWCRMWFEIQLFN